MCPPKAYAPLSLLLRVRREAYSQRLVNSSRRMAEMLMLSCCRIPTKLLLVVVVGMWCRSTVLTGCQTCDSCIAYRWCTSSEESAMGSRLRSVGAYQRQNCVGAQLERPRAGIG